MSTPLSLEAVQAEFQHWRANKAGPKTRIPAQLKQRAVDLCESYSSAKIIKALGINSSMLKNWSKQPASSNEPSNGAIEFIALPMEENKSQIKADPLHLELVQPNGNQWRLQGNVTTSQLDVFVTALTTKAGGIQ
jgi:transposase-like protein